MERKVTTEQVTDRGCDSKPLLEVDGKAFTGNCMQ